jgi:hypothetical protein
MGRAHVDHTESRHAGLATQLKKRGLLTAILSNMGDNVLANMSANSTGFPASTCLYGAISCAWPSPTRPSIATSSRTAWHPSRRDAVPRRQARQHRSRAGSRASGLEGEVPLP